MNWRTILFNGFWLLVPILIWNAIFSSRLAHPAFEHDEDVAQWLLISENVLRIGVFIAPLFLTLKWETTRSKVGWIAYIVGVQVYFGTWIPLMMAPDSAWSNSVIGFTAPAWTPLLWLVGTGLIGGWWPYVGLAVVFVAVHVSHWALVLSIVRT